MLKSDCQPNYNENPAFDGWQRQQRAPCQIPDHLKCGEVYTWLCAGEFYAVECALCTDHPLCPLSEFPQHMDIWHTEWAETTNKIDGHEFNNFSSSDSEEETQFVEKHNLGNLKSADRAVSYNSVDKSDVFEMGCQLHKTTSAKRPAEHEEILEPFEQVLIEQDPAIDTTIPIGEELNEEEYLRDVNVEIVAAAAAAAAETGQLANENKQTQMQSLVKQNLTVVNKNPLEELLTEKENELQNLTEINNNRRTTVHYPEENLISKQHFIRKKTESKQKINDKIKNDTEASAESVTEARASEINYNAYIKNNKFKLQPKSLQQKYTKLNEVKQTLNGIINGIWNDDENEEMESETGMASVNNINDKITICLHKKPQLRATNENEKMGKCLKKTVCKRNFKKLRKSSKIKRIFNNINKNSTKQNVITIETSLERDIKYQTTENSENETLIAKEHTEENQNKAMKSSKNVININENKKGLGSNEGKSKELKLKRKAICSNGDVKGKYEDETETEAKEDNINLHEHMIEIKQIKKEKETDTNEGQQQNILEKRTAIETKQNGIDKKENVNTAANKPNLYNTETCGSDKNSIIISKIQLFSTISKLKEATNDIETFNSRSRKRLQNSLDIKIQPKKRLTRKKITNAKLSETRTEGTETNFGRRQTKLYISNKVLGKNEEGTSRCQANDSNFFQSVQTIQTAQKPKSKEGQAETNKLKRIENVDVREKIKVNRLQNKNENKQVTDFTETHEIETHNNHFKQTIRKSPRITKRVDNLLKIKPRGQTETNTKKTKQYKTLKNVGTLQTTEKGTPIIETLQTSIGVNAIANEVSNTEGTNVSETLQRNIEISESKSIVDCVQQSEKICKRNTGKQRINQTDIFSSKHIQETNESETSIKHNNKTKSYDLLKPTAETESLCNNIRTSLRNIRKKSQHFRNVTQFDEHHVKTKQRNGSGRHFKDDNGGNTNYDLIQETELRGLNEFTSDSGNLMIDKLFKVDDLKNKEKPKHETSEIDEELEINTLRSSQKYLKIKVNDLSNSVQHKRMRSKLKLEQSAQHSIALGGGKKDINKFKRRLRNSQALSGTKQKLYLHAKNSLRKNLRSKVKNIRRIHKSNRRKNTCQKDKPRTAASSYESRKLMILSPVTEQEQHASACEEICSSAKENYLRNDLEPKNIKEDCLDNNITEQVTDAAGSLNSIITSVYRENIASVQGSNKINDSDQRDIEAASEAPENNDMQTQHGNAKQKDNLAEKQGTDIKETLDQLKDNSSKSNPAIAPSIEQLNNCSNSSPPFNTFSQKIAVAAITEPISPFSPKTEEEHFEFNEPREKLNKEHISHLIKLYHDHPRLWDQSHPDYCEPQQCRKSWQQITAEWNEFCKRNFTIAKVRIRICTLCQRFVQEKDRLALEGELDECAKFPYYEQMKFLEHQQSLRKRRELYEQQNEKILEIYQYFPILWHVRHYKSRQAKRRAEAFESISRVLKLFGLHLSSLGVQKRIRSLRKCYRLEKIRHLHAQVEQTPFEAEFRHYERMQFLDKHIDPFVCRICGKIFANLQGFREHLEAENHGSLLERDTDNEYGIDKDEPVDNARESLEFSSACNQMENFTDYENSTDILQRFTPLTPQSATENDYTQNLESISLNTPDEPLINSWPFEDQLIEEIMENVTNSDNFNQHGLDQFINSVTSSEELADGNRLFEEVLSPGLLTPENSYIMQQPDIISDQTCSLLSPLTNAENLISVDFGTENSLIAEHSDLMTNRNYNDSLPAEETDAVVTADAFGAKEIVMQPTVATTSPFKELERQVSAEIIAEKPCSSAALLVKVQCADYSVSLKLNAEPTLNPNLPDSDNELYASGDNSTLPLPDPLIHKMIELYRKFPQLWDPNHLDFNSRTLRRQAWVNLTMEFNSIACKQFSWRTLHRKLTDYVKYYKKLVNEQHNYENLTNKWLFYEDFKFLDDVIAVNAELQRSVHHRDNNFKIITTYKSFPHLWNIKHPDFSKRNCKQRNIELMCSRLQEEHNLQLTTERLKSRLIELRAQYRLAKKQRLKCLTNQQPFLSNEFEFYEALHFLDEHIDPFICNTCKMEFKKLTDYNQHLKKEHSQKRKRTIIPTAEPGMENVCHVCGMKFTTRSNLLHHIKRHEGIRNYACTMCPKKFYASHALKIHIRSHTKECPYTCEKCGMSFVSASKLNQHVKRHFNQKDFNCTYCPKTFFTAFEKDRHERRHLNIRDKVCPFCGKTFVAGSSYYAHLMLHSDTKRFECDKCDMKFAQYPGLFKHKKRHHT